MRIAIVSDVHGNITALEAVLADLRLTSPDRVVHGGDLCHGGSSPAEVVDRIRDLGWDGVVGNTDEMLYRPEALDEFAGQTPRMAPLCPAIRDMADAARERLGPMRLAWLAGLPIERRHERFALLHARPGDLWRAPSPEASEADMEAVYAAEDRPMAIYAHIHRPFVREMARVTVANTGSVSLSYDGDLRAAYLLLDDCVPMIRRVEYDGEREIRALKDRGVPHAGWMARILRSGRPQPL